MTDQIDQTTNTDADDVDTETSGRNHRRMFITGAGLAGAAALVGSKSASAADNDPVLAGNDVTATSRTGVINEGTNDGVPGTPDNEALYGEITEADNGSHAILGVTLGTGHSIAGDTPADAAGPDGVGTNSVAATWGRHNGIGAGIGGISVAGYGGEFIGGKSHIRLIQTDEAPAGPPTEGDHLLGEVYADGVGDLWYNTADGDNWVPLTRGGSVLFPNPARALDTRADKPNPPNANKTKFAAGETREIDLTLFTDFPATASAALINLTVVNAEGRGFATLFNGGTADADRPDTSNINWETNAGGSDVIANAATVRPDARGVIKVYTSMPTNVIIDVQGYIV